MAFVATSGVGTFSTSAAVAAPQTMEYACSVLGQLVSLNFTVDGSAPASIKPGDTLTYSVSIGLDTEGIPTTLAGAGLVGLQASRLGFTLPDGSSFGELTGAPAAAETPAAGDAGDVVIPLADPLSSASADQAISFGLQLETSGATPGTDLVLAAPSFSADVVLDLSSVGGPSASIQVADCVAPEGAQVAAVAVLAANATTTTTTTTTSTTTTTTVAATTSSTTTTTAAPTTTASTTTSSSTTSTSAAGTQSTASASTSVATDSGVAATSSAATTSVAAGDSWLPARTRTTALDASATTAPPSPAFTGASNWLAVAALALVLSGLLALRVAPWGIAGKRSASRS